MQYPREKRIYEALINILFGVKQTSYSYRMEVAGLIFVIRKEGPKSINTETIKVPIFISNNSQILIDTGTVST